MDGPDLRIQFCRQEIYNGAIESKDAYCLPPARDRRPPDWTLKYNRTPTNGNRYGQYDYQSR